MNYIGSKLSLLEFIDEVIQKEINTNKENLLLCDIFAGTNCVAKYFKEKGYSIIANDIQSFSYFLSKCLIENNEAYTFNLLKQNGIDDPFTYLNNLNERKGFIYKNYSLGGTISQEHQRLYFSDENAKKIDAIRLKISLWNKTGLLTEKEYCYLVASLVESADKVANTASVYEAFLKQIKPSASKPLVLEPVDISIYEGNHTYFSTNEDGERLISHISGDILYLDPPYNNRKYDTNYHILETIALNDSPKIKGKTGTRAENLKKSKFCIKKEAPEALENIVKNAKFPLILLSYNDEGIIPTEKIEEIFSKYGEYKRYEKQHKRYKADNSRTYLKDYTIEYLHVLKKDI